MKCLLASCLLCGLLIVADVPAEPTHTSSDYRESVVQQILDRWRDTSEATRAPRWERGMRTWLARLSDAGLETALYADSYEDLITSLGDAPAATTTELTVPLATGGRYHPLSPCRLVDTRFATGAYAGPVPARTSFNFHAKSSAEIGLQGGESGGCAVPATAMAVVVNLTVAQAAGRGHLRAYPYGGPLPTASILNFSTGNIANSTILPLCLDTCAFDFSIYAYTSTHIVVDVMGYFAE